MAICINTSKLIKNKGTITRHYLNTFLQYTKQHQHQITSQEMTANLNLIQAPAKFVFIDAQQISEHLKCSICLDIFQEPYRLKCGHTFCYMCLYNWRKKICSECKADYSTRKPQKDFIATKLVEDLPVKCNNNNCNWTGRNAEVKKHIRSCQYKNKKQANTSQDDIREIKLGQKQIIQIKQMCNSFKPYKLIINIDQSEGEEQEQQFIQHINSTQSSQQKQQSGKQIEGDQNSDSLEQDPFQKF